MAANTNGLIYYKLDIDKYGYPGDTTKNCGLRGEEIDSNFNFLRGQDIKDIDFDENDNLIIVKNNGEKLKAEKTSKPESLNYTFSYNKENGVLTISAPNGEETVLEGFAPTINIYNYHDYTLKGKGTLESPLQVNEVIKTGRYKPAIKLIDITIENNALPSENVAKYDRYVTKEKFSAFGKLYPLKGVELISERLKEINSEWRVPTKNDWDIMLNTVDCYEPNHNEETSNVFLGESAGAALKSTSYWKEHNNEILSDDNYGFTIYPVGYAGNRGKEYYGSFGESSAFWTMTEKLGNKDMFVKLFEYNSEKVGQRTWGENYYLSLRLVKDFKENNFNNTEIIDGTIVECVHIPETNLIWTKCNVDFTKEEYDAFSPIEWEQYENNQNDSIAYNVRYFVNEWDGEKWEKYELNEGDGIVLKEGEFGKSHEWLVVNGELTDISVLINFDLRNDISTLNNRINQTRENLTTIINEQDSILEEKITKNIQDNIDTLSQIDEKILQDLIIEKNRAESSEKELEDLINEKSVLLNNSIEALNNECDNLETNVSLLNENAHTHSNKDVIDNITQSNINTWNNAEKNAVKTATAYTQSVNSLMNERVDTLENASHTHNNLSLLNTINEVKVSEWNNAKQIAIEESNEYTDREILTLSNSVNTELQLLKTSAHTHTDYTALNRITDERINDWNAIETRVKYYADETFLRKDIAEATYVTLTRLSNELRELSDRISVLEGKMEQTISYIEGTGGEISVSKSGNIATVSFDPNAEFEATLEEE